MRETNGLFHYFDGLPGKGETGVVDKRLKEARQHGDAGFPASCYHIRFSEPGPAAQLECHWHDEMELFRLERGTARVRCGSEYFTARAGQLVFFNSGELHAAQLLEGGPLEYTAVVFSPELLCGGENDAARRKYVAPAREGKLHPRRVTDDAAPQGEETLGAFSRAVALLEERPPAFELWVRAKLLEVFAALAAGAQAGAPAGERAPDQGVKAAIEYIRGHFREHITISQLARLSHMSDGHFCRLFKRYTFKTPVQYINGVRLSAATDLLEDSSRKELDIALETGFNSLSYFIGVFKQSMGCTPTEYRRRRERQEKEDAQ